MRVSGATVCDRDGGGGADASGRLQLGDRRVRADCDPQPTAQFRVHIPAAAAACAVGRRVDSRACSSVHTSPQLHRARLHAAVHRSPLSTGSFAPAFDIYKYYINKAGFSFFLLHKSHCFKTANIKIVSTHYKHRSQLAVIG